MPIDAPKSAPPRSRYVERRIAEIAAEHALRSRATSPAVPPVEGKVTEAAARPVPQTPAAPFDAEAALARINARAATRSRAAAAQHEKPVPVKPVDPLIALLAGRPASPVQLPAAALLRSPCARIWCQRLTAIATAPGRRESGIGYLRGGAIRDLEVKAGTLTGIVQGEVLHQVTVTYPLLAPALWQRIGADYLKHLGTQWELLKGQISERSLAPLWGADSPIQPHFNRSHVRCTCPEHGSFCKHAFAVLYGAAVRFEDQNELMLHFRGVSTQDFVREAHSRLASPPGKPGQDTRRVQSLKISEFIEETLRDAAPG